MAPKINKKLLPLKIHYFLKYGGMSFFPFLPALIRQKGVSEGGVGLIWTVIPLTSAATNMLVGTVADYFKLHRVFFMAGMFTLTITFTSVFFMPNVPEPRKDPLLATLSLQCPQDSAKFVVCPHSNPYWYDIVSKPTMNDCDANDNISTTLMTDQMNINYNLRCKMYGDPDGDGEESLHFPSEFSLSLDKHQSEYNVCSSRNCTIITEVNVTSTFSELYNVSCRESSKMTCEYRCETSYVETAKVTINYLLTSVQFWVIFMNMMILYAGNGVTTTMADTVCFFLLGKNRHKYGHQRLWGSLAWGMIGMTSGALVTYFSHNKSEVDYTPVVAISITFLVANLFVSFTIKFDVPKKEKLKASIVGHALCSFKMIVFLLTVMVGGITMGTQWTFFFIVVEDIAIAWDPSFNFIKLIQGLLLGIECFFGEVPFLFLSSFIIKKLGNVRTFSGVLVILTMRCFLYSCVTNPWYFLPIEFLHGPSFGLLYPNMITYANALAPKGAQATIQGIVKSTFVGGVSLGGLIGGVLLEKFGGSKAYMCLGLFDLSFTLVFIIANLARDRLKVHRSDNASDQCEYVAQGSNDHGYPPEDEEAPLNSPVTSLTSSMPPNDNNGNLSPQAYDKPPEDAKEKIIE
ncbi:major facilitator superfamily domain-containing protein 6-like [Macrobrachium rosenbergii]|uniref:major facilitator superfamily domain-containing protein 6-like n=1 Tax=Macrobrachium rosenbergii TaxID=79674 RepID=UPI0034D548EE